MSTSLALGNARLLQLAEILDTADERHPGYDQRRFLHPCGSPACAMGEWAAANPDRWDLTTRSPEPRDGSNCFDAVFQEFAIDDQGYEELFSFCGCGDAKSSKDAAAYIRGFVARRSAS